MVADGPSLCERCAYAHIQRGFRDTEVLVHCVFGWNETPRLVPFKVRECTDFSDTKVPKVSELEDIALILNAQPTGKKAGFSVKLEDVTEEPECEPVAAETTFRD